ncbi:MULTISPECIES: glutamate racemase [unclassified Candidatus Frackibacter]|uniref:glutamate racemase n=1 Tax=unclassified Candidatus Frackibacter TaxID=2648818 RepID=UPI00088DE0F4|nr:MULTISPECIES: glutamate racemase [unclassified Candidatus Frackibacter]SDC15445.1 glutamate racemase [Candidatus Frackibacter sp. WG11]SEM46233.1 glutamate racemase [Candidatus Frackibacter sp. WG12]SFL48282.1 glutamate racemase [Candidatus Frackibacter sp. WG13]
MKSSNPIALFDSGVGGLTVTKEVMNEFPDEDVIHFGDTLHLPYGPRPQKEVRGFAFEIIDYLIEILNVKLIIIACNTATAAALKIAQDEFEVPIIGPVKPGAKAAIKKTKNQKIGVIATKGTISSKAYHKEIKLLSKEVEIFAKACPEFVTLVERGKVTGLEVEEVVEGYLASLREVGVDTLLLGCTHFPYLSQVIQKVIGPDVNLIYPGREIAIQAREILSALDDLNKQPKIGSRTFYVSDLDNISYDFVKVGREFLGLDELQFKELPIFDKPNLTQGIK